MVTLSEGAADRVRVLIAGRGPETGLRLGVTRGGCAGFSYSLAFEDQPTDSDHAFESHGVWIYVDARTLPLVAGSEIDYVDTIERTGFDVHNPNVVSACGCGSSFQTQEAANRS